MSMKRKKEKKLKVSRSLFASFFFFVLLNMKLRITCILDKCEIV